MPHVGGVNTYLQLLRKELERRGHRVDLLAHDSGMRRLHVQSGDPGRDGRSIVKSRLRDNVYGEINGYYDRELPHVDHWIRMREIERYTFELAAACFDLEAYDIIHTHDIVSTRALSRVKPARVPLIYTLQGLLASVHRLSGEATDTSGLRWSYIAAEEHYGTASADCVIATSRWLWDELRHSFGVPAAKLTAVVPYGMDAGAFLGRMNDAPESPVPPASGRLVILCPARLGVEKGHATLIAALGILKESRDDFMCWIVGDGPLRGELEAYCREQGVADRVVFTGNRSDVPALLKLADVMVMPSIEDNLPHAVMEAQIAGKAIVASNGGGIPEMIEHGRTGLLFEKANGVDLARKLSLALGDAQLRRRLGEQAKAYGGRQWSVKRLGGRTLQVYEKAIAAQRHADPPLQPAQLADAAEARPGGRAGRMPADLFRFETCTVFFNREWSELAGKLPAGYTIPARLFFKRLQTGGD